MERPLPMLDLPLAGLRSKVTKVTPLSGGEQCAGSWQSWHLNAREARARARTRARARARASGRVSGEKSEKSRMRLGITYLVCVGQDDFLAQGSFCRVFLRA